MHALRSHGRRPGLSLPFAAPLAAALAVMLVVAATGADRRAEASPGPRGAAIGLRLRCQLRGVHGVSSDSANACRALSGWFEGRLDWLSGGALLYSETGTFYALPGAGEIIAHADGEGVDFAAVYESSMSSVLAAPELSVRLYVRDGGQDSLVLQQRYVPEAMALWSAHSQDSAALRLEIQREHEERLSDEEGVRSGAEALISAESIVRAAEGSGLRERLESMEAATLPAVRQRVDSVAVDLIGEAAMRRLADEAMWQAILRQVVEVHAVGPIVSSGGTHPTLGLELCAEGEVLQIVGGKWTCSSLPDADRAPVAKGDPGAPGATGPIGPAGPAGPAGPRGPRGEAGTEGPSGRDGRPGIPGERGPAGSRGPAGPAGREGVAGPAGVAGAQGPAGPAGPIGPIGLIGPRGPALLGGVGREASLLFARGGFRTVSVSCPDGEHLTGCTGYFNLVCDGSTESDRCAYLGAYPDDLERPNRCVAEAYNTSGVAGTLFVDAICHR